MTRSQYGSNSKQQKMAGHLYLFDNGFLLTLFILINPFNKSSIEKFVIYSDKLILLIKFIEEILLKCLKYCTVYRTK
jgi:hypothetical protein